ncbi:DHS-like NAD/FAD-binding domain-containing protein [Xylaria nigripes]|nr:DHS-like NAD/FAD-binding domain-containing protein [Xylaria nigripes]
MGQESSSLVPDDVPPDTLSERSVPAIADFIRSGRAKRIVVMTGAGISTAAGIPDFRSPNTGIYHNLARLDLPHAEAVFEIDFFRQNPHPFYVLAKELYPGNFHPTISHVFVSLLAKKKLLHKLFTQNIDCLERAAGVPSDLIVEAHGSFATQRCIDCQMPFSDVEMRKCVELASPAVCAHDDCGGFVKPDIVFFGEQLPSAFFANASVPQEADLVIIVGTSLTVYPFAGLPRQTEDGVPRLLLNLERVGDIGTRADDVLCLGGCDDGVRKLADELGWRAELEDMWVKLVGEEEAERQRSRKLTEAVHEELDELVESLEQRLKLSEGHDDHTSDIIANANTQEKTEGERPTTISETHPTGEPDCAPLATGEELPKRPVSSTELEAQNGQTNSEKAANHRLVHHPPHAATVEDGKAGGK